MHIDDAKEFYKLLDATQETSSGREPLSADAKQMIFEDLAEWSFDVVKMAMRAHRKDPQRGQWQISAAHIEHQIQRRMPVQWIGADEAFAQMTFDESAPLLLNQVTGPALAAATPFMAQHRPDQNAARMAYRACYNRLAEMEKLAGRPPLHFISPAGTSEERAALQIEAARLGYLKLDGTPFKQPAAASQLGNSTPPPGAMEALRSFSLKSLPPPEADHVD